MSLFLYEQFKKKSHLLRKVHTHMLTEVIETCIRTMNPLTICIGADNLYKNNCQMSAHCPKSLAVTSIRSRGQ